MWVLLFFIAVDKNHVFTITASVIMVSKVKILSEHEIT